jgi:hypothetical protein
VWRFLSTSYALAISALALLGTAFGIYTARPYPTVTIVDSLDRRTPYGQMFSISNNGHLPMTDVHAGTIHSFILFENGDFMSAPCDTMLYSHPNTVSAGESFTLQIGRASRLFVLNDREKILTFGPPSQADTGYVKFTENVQHRHKFETVHKHPPLELSAASEIATKAIDARLVTKYRVAFIPYVFTREWRFISARNEQDGTFHWRSLTASEPSLDRLKKSPGHHDGFTVPCELAN